jgi:hypothetical protein
MANFNSTKKNYNKGYNNGYCNGKNVGTIVGLAVGASIGACFGAMISGLSHDFSDIREYDRINHDAEKLIERQERLNNIYRNK